ncbi:hypothetical protein Hanom_Chr04g00347491 [Helianthus anomalus]
MNLGCEAGLGKETLHLGTTKVLPLEIEFPQAKLTLSGNFLPFKSDPLNPNPFAATLPLMIARFSAPYSIEDVIIAN